jgi:hypothetical protein
MAEFYLKDNFLCLDGPAKLAGETYSQMKVCFTTCREEILKNILIDLSSSQNCYWVKMSTIPRDGMLIGRCFFTTKEAAGKVWAKYKHHPFIIVNLQDDEFAQHFRTSNISTPQNP